MILRLRQLCSHPYLILVSQTGLTSTDSNADCLSQTSDASSGDATAVTGVGEGNELRRAVVIKGHDWVNMVQQPWLPFLNEV